MAFVRKNLEKVAGTIQQSFHYNAGADTLATVKGASYFDAIKDEVGAGDVILVKSNNLAAIDTCMITSARGVSPVVVISTEADSAT